MRGRNRILYGTRIPLRKNLRYGKTRATRHESTFHVAWGACRQACRKTCIRAARSAETEAHYRSIGQHTKRNGITVCATAIKVAPLRIRSQPTMTLAAAIHDVSHKHDALVALDRAHLVH